MSEPKIMYGIALERPIHLDGQYLLMEAGITDGTYPTKDFIDRIKGVSLDKISIEEGERAVRAERKGMASLAGIGDTVTIRDFNPDRAELEGFVNTTIRDYKRNLR